MNLHSLADAEKNIKRNLVKVNESLFCFAFFDLVSYKTRKTGDFFTKSVYLSFFVKVNSIKHPLFENLAEFVKLTQICIIYAVLSLSSLMAWLFSVALLLCA
jgi:hypothetical protein